MRFIQPQLFYLVLPVLLAVIVLAVYASHCRKQKVRALLGNGDTDPAAVKLSPPRRRFRIFLLLLTMLFLIAAAARPFWSSQLVPFEPRGRDLMVIFDVSKSMLATDIAPSRLEHAKFLLRQLVESAPNDRFGLVAFAGKAYLACPLTSDSLAFTQYIDELNTDTVPLGGTNLEAALRVAEQAFKAAAGGNRGILLFTDGDELAGNSAALVNELRKRQIPLFIVGLGDPEVGAPVPEADGTLKRDASGQLITSKLAETSLKKLAGETGGVYVRSTVTDTGLAVIENRIKRLDTAEQQGAQRTLPIEKFPLALIAAAICLVLYFLLSERPLEYRFSRPKSAALLLLPAMLFLLAGAAAPEKPETAPAQQPKEIPVEPEPPSDPAELYNLARERQIAGDEKAANLYETVIRDAADRPDLQTRSLYNLGTGEHRNARTIAQQAVAKVKAQQLDPALEELKKAEGRLKSAEELYVRSLEIPQLQNAVPEASNNLQQLADDRKKIEELKKKIEELKKLQQQAQQQTQQAQQQNQKDQQKQDQKDQQKQDQQQGQQGQDQKDQQKQDQQQGQDQKDQQKQDQQQGQQGQDQKDQQKQDQQQGQDQKDQQKQDQQQKSGENALDQARKSAEELKNKADELQQQNLSKQAEQARQELDKAKESREQQKFDEAQKHLEEAMKALGGSQGQDQKDQQSKDQKDQQGKDQKDQQGKDQKDQQQQGKEGQQDQKEQQGEEAKPEDGKMDEKTAEQLLQMMADEEKGLRDAIKQHQRSRQPRVEKDW
ncbi:VWA domain-containing protein [Victivallis vadensis]|uniref:VWA domain-containing protein n=1 Tax=Victivallis vadensis TaxID=172901 RepID=A0A848AVL7_9BACT|nr:VWA domain-containing protein [Victivallis vadensis]NMD85590.1 VWA domain-containing protein [Victivallis vadensis]